MAIAQGGLTVTDTYLHFDETDGAVAFFGPPTCEAFRAVVHRWPCRPASDGMPVFALCAAEGAGTWRVTGSWPEPWRRDHDPVNAICDLVVELNWSRLRARADLMCLHAGAVAMGGGLVVFPAGRRAGKSTLSAELARRGHTIFSDDILAVTADEEGVAQGLGTGIAPRLRLPLPPEAPAVFADWVAADAGPSNRQYSYLTDAPVAAQGQAAALGAIVVLDRDAGAGAPRVSPMAADAVMPLLIHQNFGRFVHSGRALATFAALVRDLPCLKLSYASFDAAADCLETLAAEGRFGGQAISAPGHAGAADFDRAPVAAPVPGRAYRQGAGFTEVSIGGEAYVADAAGRGIFRLNPGMIPIWRLLAEPVDTADVVDVLAEIFPEVARDTLDADVAQAFEALAAADLIEPA